MNWWIRTNNWFLLYSSKTREAINEIMDALATELPRLQSMDKTDDTYPMKVYSVSPIWNTDPGNIEDFGLRQFNDADDWVNRVPW
ncbi:MAG: hypothetical protein WCK53_05880 [Methanomicrobiales archaeon]